jgi:cell division transport system ATP-binding protein
VKRFLIGRRAGRAKAARDPRASRGDGRGRARHASFRPVVRFDRVGLGGAAPAAGAAEAQALTRPILDAVSFALAPASFHWLLGPSGAGKTSLLGLMHLALRPSSGTIELMGHDVGKLPRGKLPALRRAIGFVYQDFRLLPRLSVFDNVALPLRLAGRPEAGIAQDVTEMLRWVGLADRLWVPPSLLSGGEQQRVAVARAVVAGPRLLLADEPTGNLDAAAADRLMHLFGEMNALGTTVVVATHSTRLPRLKPAPSLRLSAGRLVGHD